MSFWRQRLVMLMTSLFLATAIGQSEPVSLIAASLAVVAVTAVLAVHRLVLVATSRELTVGERARGHRHSLTSMPAPRHPNTAGRPRTRAPAIPAAVT